MTKKWYHNAKTGEIGSYNEYESGETDFPRGLFLAYSDYLTVGFSTEGKAIEWSKEWGGCDKCKGASSPNKDGVCFRCGEAVKFVPIVTV